MTDTLIFANAIVITPGAVFAIFIVVIFWHVFSSDPEPEPKPKPKSKPKTHPVKWGVYRHGQLLYVCDSKRQADLLAHQMNLPSKPWWNRKL